MAGTGSAVDTPALITSGDAGIYNSGKIWAGWNAQINIVSNNATGASGNIVISSGTVTSNSWVTWNEAYQPTTASITANSPDTILIQAIWQGWNSRLVATDSLYVVPATTPVLTPAEQAERRRVADALAATYAKQREEQERLEKIANSKAERLLRSCLSKQQTEDLEKKNCFYLYVGEKKYRVDRGYAGNVKLVDESDKVLVSYCIHPSERTPAADSMLMQKLLLECDEKYFLQTANPTVHDTRFQHLSRRAA